MANFFDGAPGRDFEGFLAYVKSHTPSQTLADIRASGIDPNDLPSLGDMARMFLKEEGREHAIVFYTEGIRQLEESPGRLAPDVNLSFARCSLCACYMPDRAAEALTVIEKDPSLVSLAPELTLSIAAKLVEAGQLRGANALLERIDQIPLENLLPKLESAGINFEMVEFLKKRVRQGLGTRKMRDLNWLIAPGTGKPPEGLLDIEINALAKEGIPSEVLAAVKTAVVLSASNDRKMWFCSFFDVNDPRPLLGKGIMGRFRADFYNRIGRFGEDGQVNIYGVHHP